MLTKRQVEVIMKFWKRGYFFSWELSSVFSTEKSKTNCLNTLTAYKIITEDNFKFHINREEFLKYQKELENMGVSEYGA